MSPEFNDAAATLRLHGYTDAWHLGTGLPEALPPGEYAVTGRKVTPHGLVLEVVGRFHVRLPFQRREVDAYAPLRLRLGCLKPVIGERRGPGTNRTGGRSPGVVPTKDDPGHPSGCTKVSPRPLAAAARRVGEKRGRKGRAELPAERARFGASPGPAGR